MTDADRLHWAQARTLSEIGEVTALWLEGAIESTPTHGGGPDPETAVVREVLTACNRAGFITEHSQPGVPRDRDGSAQRAAVHGFVSPADFPALMNAFADGELLITATRAGAPGLDWGPSVVITLDLGEEFTWEGGATSHTGIEDFYGRVCHEDAVVALCAAWQVTIIDPEWGRNDVLWPRLQRFSDRARE